MHVVVLASATLLICTFVTALYAKARNTSEFRHSLSSFGFPASTRASIVMITLGAEALVLMALLIAPLRWAGVACLLLHIAFTVLSGLAMLRGRHPQCQCFGNFTSDRIGLQTMLRNAALAVAGVLLLTERQPLGPLVRSSASETLIMAVLVVAIAALVAILLILLTRYGEALQTLDSIGVDTVTRTQRWGLKPGASVPEMTLQDWDSHRVAITEEVRSAKSWALVLLSKTCGHCKELIPALERASVQGVSGVVIVHGKDSSIVERLRGIHEYHWPVLFTEEAELTSLFRIAGFPALVPLDGRGNVEGGTRLGRRDSEGFLDTQLAAFRRETDKEPNNDDRQARQTARKAEHSINPA